MMLDRSYSAETLDDLACLVAHARHGAGGAWQIPGIKAALVKAANRPGETITLGKLAHVALKVAEDPDARTPEVICWDGPWWNADRPTERTHKREELCSICNLPDHRHPLEYDVHNFTPPADVDRQSTSTDHRARAAAIREQMRTSL